MTIKGWKTPERKTCRKCGIEKPASEFGWKDKKKGYLRSTCKACDSIRNKAYREANKERINAQNREWYYAHREEILAENKRKRRLNRKYKKLSQDQRQRLFEDNRKLVVHIAKRYKCHESLYEDMIQAGYEGLWEAICELDKFKPLKSKLSTWFGWYIQRALAEFTYAAANNSGLSAGAWAVKNAMMRNDRDAIASGREEDIRLFSTSRSLSDKFKNDKSKKEVELSEIIGEEDAHYDGISEAVRVLLSGLDDFHRDVIVNRFGIGCDAQSLPALARRYAITPERARQLVEQSLEQLRELPGASGLAVYL